MSKLSEIASHSDVSVVDAIAFNNYGHEKSFEGITVSFSTYKLDCNLEDAEFLYEVLCESTKCSFIASRKPARTSKKGTASSSHRLDYTPIFRTLPILNCSIPPTRHITSASESMRHKQEPTLLQLRLSEGHRAYTLTEMVRLNQRLSDKNIVKWSLQLLEIVHSYHHHCICFMDLSSEDIVVTSDKSVLLMYTQGTSHSPLKKSRELLTRMSRDSSRHSLPSEEDSRQESPPAKIVKAKTLFGGYSREPG